MRTNLQGSGCCKAAWRVRGPSRTRLPGVWIVKVWPDRRIPNLDRPTEHADHATCVKRAMHGSCAPDADDYDRRPGRGDLMFTDNPFADLATLVSPALMQAFVGVMLIFVVGGTLFDISHKKSARYFFNNWRETRNRAKRRLGGGEIASLALKTAVMEGLVSGEFCSARRRIAHLLTMYGFLAYTTATIVMVFWYPTRATPAPAIVPEFWHIGALMVCAGGYWFWLFIRVDVVAEGNSPFRVVRADLFILALLANVTLALVWAWFQASGNAAAYVFLVLYLVATLVLFGSVPWSKFSHMFYKPAAAFQKRLEDANGSRSNLPPAADKPKIFGSVRRHSGNY